MRYVFLMCMGWCLSAGGISTATAAPLNTAVIEQITSLPGVLDSNGVFKISVPRNEFQVNVDGRPLSPFMGLRSWAAFSTANDGNTVVMGDIALFQDEVNPALSAALTNGLSVTALNTRFLFDEPKIYYMRIYGRDGVKQLASAFNSVLHAIRQTRLANPNLAVSFGGLPPPGRNAITGGTIENILGVKGRNKDGMFKVVIGHPVNLLGLKVGEAMGAGTWAVFSGVDDNATMDGAIAVPQDGLQGVLKTLCHGGIYITGINSQMTDETPRMLFVDFWGKGDTRSLAKTLKAALGMPGK